MSSAANILIDSASSSACTPTGTRKTVELRDELRLLLSIWDSLTPNEQSKFLKTPGNELASAVVDSLTWMCKWTKTRDDQDQQRPYKPLPNKPYFHVLHADWLCERVLYVEKSRSMITSWWAAGEALHQVMTHQPSKAIFWAQDEDRAVVLRDYVWTLYEQQAQVLRDLYPVPRPRIKQSYDKMQLTAGGLLIALPGKDPDKIRSEHPTLLVMDEANFIENGGEAFDVALASRVPKVVLISTAAPSWLRRVTKAAIPEREPQEIANGDH
jgi:hypothetical protein